jgi:arylsulfatase A-like enzyme/Flp pilus assembly protein TadD
VTSADRLPNRRPPARATARVPVLLLAVLFAASCGDGRGLPFGRPSSPPVIIISIDTLRSDRLPMYGYRGVETPHLDALRADSILYQRAYSHCPLTLPAHTSMLSGLLPSEHGVRDNIGFTVSKEVPLLPQLLKEKGYRTGAAISAFVLRRDTGLARGFDFYDDEVEPLGAAQVIGRVQRDGRETARIATNWIESQAGSPFFFFLHLYEPHTPYLPPEPFLSRYKDRYDGEIAYSDAIVGDVLAGLKSKGLYDDALIIVTSDHGEGLNDHGEEEHGIFLYREALQVPLLVKMPRAKHAGSTVDAPAQLIDVFATVADAAGVKTPRANKDARSLPTLLADAPQRLIYSESYYPKLHFGWSDLHSLIRGNDHFIRAPQPELYDLGADPREKTNSIEANRRAFVQLRQAIEPFVKEAEKPAAIDPEEARKLAALGYVGSSVATAPGEALPDPKTTIGVFHQIRVAFTHYRDEEHDRALALTNQLLRENSKMVDLWDLKSKILVKLGDPEGAIEAAKEGLRVSPTAPALALTVANLAMSLGRLEEAEQHAELAIKTEPGQAHDALARVAAHRKDYAKAEQYAKLAMEKSHDPAAALLTLGLIRKQQDDLEGALRYFNEAAAKVETKRNRRIPNLHYYRGDVLARLGRNADAEQAFRAEIAAYPTAPDAYASLILLLSATGRVEEATRLVFTLIEKAPVPPSYVAVSETLKAIGDDRGARYWAYQGLQKFPSHAELRSLLRT